MSQWRPEKDGELVLPPTLRSLEKVRDRAVVVSGLDSNMAEGKDTAVHARIQSAWLTGCRPKRTEGPDIHLGISMDQVIAREFEKDTQISSIELAMEPSDLAGACLPGYSCAYNNTVSWRNATTPNPMEHAARGLRAPVRRVAGHQPRSAPEDGAEAAQHPGRGDREGRPPADGPGHVGPRQARSVLEAIRDVERRLQKAERQTEVELPSVDKPSARVPERWDEHAALMFDLLHLAFQTDLTRVFTFALGRELSVRTFNEIGVADAHHPLSHHEDDPAKIAKLAKLQAYQMQGFARFLEKLQATRDGDGTLLDRSLFFYGAGMSNSNIHFHYDLPALVVAGKDLPVTGGRHHTFKGKPLANLQLTIIEKLGLPVEKFGDSNGELNLLAGV